MQIELSATLNVTLTLNLTLWDIYIFAYISLKNLCIGPKFLQLVGSTWGNKKNFSHFRRRTNITRYVTFYHSYYHVKYFFAIFSVNNCSIALKFSGILDDFKMHQG